MTEPRALVTGGAGFIGSHLVEELLRRGHRVTVIDNFSTGRPGNLAHLRDHPALRFVRGSILEPGPLEACFPDIDWVFHLAALADIVPSIERPTEYYEANVTGTLRVLEAARANRVKRFLYTASSSCYGIPDQYPTPETAEIRPQYPYALTKWLGETTALHWARVYGLPVLSLRLFNVFGPRVRTTGTYGAVFGVFLAQKIHNRPFTVVGDGNQTRDFTFVTDVVEAYLRAAQSDLVGEALNVGSGGTYSVNRLVELLQGPVTRLPKRPGEPECTWADITRIRKLLGWNPSVPFEDGVRRMLERLSDWHDAPLWTPESIAEATKGWFAYLAPRSRQQGPPSSPGED